jgi:transcriptional regulator with XRE-family HTH domain
LDTELVKKTELNYKNVVGARVRALRLNAELSQEVLSERCGIFRTYLSRIESGSANPTLVVLVALAHSLNVEPHVLLSMDELIF